MTSVRIVFAGGGTGGHLMPGVALAQEMSVLDPQSEVLFFVQGNAVERRILESNGFRWRGVPAGRSRRNPIRLACQIARLAWGTAKALSLLAARRPGAVVGLGGYVSAPPLAAARVLGLPIFLLEQNAVVGKVNRWFEPSARALFMPWDLPEGVASPRRKPLGNPVRLSIRNLSRPARREGPPTVLVLGGSQGAAAINRMMLRTLPAIGEWKARPRFLHVAGASMREQMDQAYRRHACEAQVFEFADPIDPLYARADLAVSRAGGTTLAELAVVGLPAILVPLPAAAEDHQRANARVFERAGAAIVVEEGARGAADCARELAALLSDPARLSSMAEGARSLARPLAGMEIATWIMKDVVRGAS